MAEYVLRHQAAAAGEALAVASAGTSGWHDGEDMHAATAAVLRRHGIDPGGFCSRRLRADDLEHYDYLVAMDQANLAELERCFGCRPQRIFKLTDLVPELGYDEVPDPWYSGDFDETWRLVSAGCVALRQYLANRTDGL